MPTRSVTPLPLESVQKTRKVRDDELYRQLGELVEIQTKLNMLKAVSTRKRMEILIFLHSKNKPLPFAHLVETFKLNNSTLVEHLKILEESGLIVNNYKKSNEHKRHYSFYEITEKGRELLKSLKIAK